MSRGQRPIDRIVPDGFVEEWNAASVEEALARAENAPSTTDEDEFKRCPECLSQRIHKKTPGENCSHQRPEPRKCVNCVNHFDEPLPPRAAFDVDDPGCPECGSRRLDAAAGAAAAWECLDCEWSGDTAAEEPRESLVPISADRADGFEWVAADELAEPADRAPLGEFRDERLADLVVALYDATDASYRDLATVVPYSRAWVGRRVRGEA